MWNVEERVIPVITEATRNISKSFREATRNISKSFRQYLSNKLGKHETKELQKTAILGNEYILQKVLIKKYKTYFTGKITLHVAQTVNTKQLQHYIP
jgi:hypothetical protein